jgi:glycosyltransferase involved in cell wall biosynthesis
MLGAAPAVWSRFPDAYFVFIGPRTRHSRSLFRRHHDRRVLELGVVDLETKTNALAACDLLCVPSTQESFGAVFPEAWMLGKPVIGGTAPAVREVISHGVDGYVLEQDPDSIAQRIIYLLAHPAARKEMGRRGMEKTLERYSWERLSRETEAVYQSALR